MFVNQATLGTSASLVYQLRLCALQISSDYCKIIPLCASISAVIGPVVLMCLLRFAKQATMKSLLKTCFIKQTPVYKIWFVLTLWFMKRTPGVWSFCWFVSKFLYALIAFLIAWQWKCEHLLGEKQPKGAHPSLSAMYSLQDKYVVPTLMSTLVGK